MYIAFRADASSQMGTGHFMRCLTLADALTQRGAHCRFISRQLPAHLGEMLTVRGHEFAQLSTHAGASDSDELTHAAWLGVSQSADAKESTLVLSDRHWDWLVVDHYAIDGRWESRLRSAAGQIMVIDDLADRQHDCDVLLDQNYYRQMESRYSGRVPTHCRLLLGPRYALLREEFQYWRARISPRCGPVKRVLVFFGGVDADNCTGQTLKALRNIDHGELTVDVVIGAGHPNRVQIESMCADAHYSCHVQTQRIAELMAAADLAIGAGGGATWERCCLGLPCITLCTADNQSMQVAHAAVEGLLYAPELHGDIVRGIGGHLMALMENNFLRQCLSLKSLSAIDVFGAQRVLEKMGCSAIQLRRAAPSDAEDLFRWRNHPRIRAVSRSGDAIEWVTHQTWLASVLSSADRVLLIGLRGGAPIGVVRFDIRQETAEVSIYIVPGTEESGLGGALLQEAEHWLAEHLPGVRELQAQVLGNNQTSHRLFIRSDFELASTSYSKRLK
jgi:UDP-2,4-diacetamido-2,4,6-trideoxy-beta-L-altropyranose hydrolase